MTRDALRFECRQRGIFTSGLKSDIIDRLQQIRGELEAVTSAEFWEVSDRGINFEYLEPERRAQIATFFSWFDGLS